MLASLLIPGWYSARPAPLTTVLVSKCCPSTAVATTNSCHCRWLVIASCLLTMIFQPATGAIFLKQVGYANFLNVTQPSATAISISSFWQPAVLGGLAPSTSLLAIFTSTHHTVTTLGFWSQNAPFPSCSLCYKSLWCGQSLRSYLVQTSQ